MDEREIEALSEKVRKATEARHRAASLSFLSCAIELLVTTVPLNEAAEELRRRADHLEEFG